MTQEAVAINHTESVFQNSDAELQLLAELQLVMIGGGIGTVTVA